MKFGWRGALGVAVSAVFLYYAFRQLDLSRAIEKAREANYWLLAASAITATLMFPLRAIRWRTILDPIAPKLPLGPLWRSVAIGQMVTNVVPLRAGELARAFALNRQIPSVSFATSLASVAVDRVFDGIVTMLLLAAGVVLAHFPASTIVAGHYTLNDAAWIVVAGSMALLIGFYALVFFPGTLIRLFELVARRVSPTVERRGSEMLRRFSEGLSVLKTPGHFAVVTWWTLLHWLLQPVAFWLGLLALNIHVSFAATLVLQGIIVILVAIPAAPGFFGPFEIGASIALGLYNVSNSDALTWAFLFHFASFIPITLIGAYYFVRLGVHMGDINSAANSGQ